VSALGGLFLEAALMVIAPMVAWSQTVRRLALGRLGWALVGYGALFYLAGWVLGRPAGLIVVATGFGSSAALLVAVSALFALVDEAVRYVAFRYVGQIREALSLRTAAAYGVGAGGFGMLVFGLVMLATGLFARNYGAEPPPAVAGEVERLSQAFPAVLFDWVVWIALQIGMSMVAAQAVVRRSRGLFGAALGWRALGAGGARLLQLSVGDGLLPGLWLAATALATIAYAIRWRGPTELDAPVAAPPPDQAVDDSAAVAAGRS
jgi:uncharacterized membrane protein YhfC